MFELNFEELEKIYKEDEYGMNNRLESYEDGLCFANFCSHSINGPKLLLVETPYGSRLTIHLWCDNCLPKKRTFSVLREVTVKELFTLRLLRDNYL